MPSDPDAFRNLATVMAYESGVEAGRAAERARVVITPQMFRAALVASWNPDERVYDDAAAIAHLNAALTAAPRGTTREGG